MADGEDPAHGTREENPKFLQKGPGGKVAAGAGEDPTAERVPVATGSPELDRILNEYYARDERERPAREARRRIEERIERERQETTRLQQAAEERDFLAGRLVTGRIPSQAERNRGVREVYPWFYEQVKARIEAKRRQDPQGGRRHRRKTRKHRKSTRRTRRH